MPIEIIPAHEVSLAEQARIFTEAFTGYVGGSLAVDGAALARFICAHGADLCYSRLTKNENGLCGFGYVARTGDISRLCGMGVIAPARRTGVGRALLLQLLAEANTRADRAMMLEVIEQNPSAHALYREERFREMGRLLGWRRAVETTAAEANVELEEISLAVASQLPLPLEFPELPWQISRHATAKLAAGRAYVSGSALVVFDDAGGETAPARLCLLSSLGSGEINWPAIRELFAAVLQRHAGREFFAPAIFPETFGEGVFVPLGFKREAISQFLMRHDL
ncbi:MAG TPA: GNAT family N-acetyltransferase [Chthoniobacterales bacterium]|jgi:GNAT superfamily N-acetyltransferase|nr:GNAT family N-acetyltransferase [Chthoniobacterales bacterium]